MKFNFLEGFKNKEVKVDENFEKEKDNKQWENRQDVYKGLALKFSELIKENPIVVYTQDDNFAPTKNIGFDNVEDVRTDESGTGGSSTINFNSRDWVSVGKNGFSSSSYFDKKNKYYKITEESLSNIMRMMKELINRSGYSDQDKAKMFQDLSDNFKDKIIKEEDLILGEK